MFMIQTICDRCGAVIKPNEMECGISFLSTGETVKLEKGNMCWMCLAHFERWWKAGADKTPRGCATCEVEKCTEEESPAYLRCRGCYEHNGWANWGKRP